MPLFNPLVAPTITALTATGTQVGWLFTISGTPIVSVGDTYTNNGHTYTVQIALAGTTTGAVLYMSGTGVTSGTTLTRSAGSGAASITFSANVATALYTPPSNALYLDVTMVGGGGGGGASTSPTGGTAGGTTYFAGNFCTGGGVGGNQGSLAIGAGGTATIASFTGYLATALAGAAGTGAAIQANTNGSPGGSSPFGGAGAGGVEAGNGQNAVANTGSGGGGAGANSTVNSNGGGGGAGAYAEFTMTVNTAGYPYIIGAGGNAQTGTKSGGTGASGVIIIKEYYQ